MANGLSASFRLTKCALVFFSPGCVLPNAQSTRLGLRLSRQRRSWNCRNCLRLYKLLLVAIRICRSRRHSPRRREMRPQDKSGNQQMNLTLIDQRAVNLPDERERELALALLELLLNAAAEPAEPQPSDPLQN